MEVAKVLQVLRWFLLVLYRFEQFPDDDYQLPRKLTKSTSLFPHIVLILTLHHRKLILARHRCRAQPAEQQMEYQLGGVHSVRLHIVIGIPQSLRVNIIKQLQIKRAGGQCEEQHSLKVFNEIFTSNIARTCLTNMLFQPAELSQ